MVFDYYVVTVGGRERPRSEFIRSTYLHLCCAIAALAIFSALLFESGIGFRMLSLLAGSHLGWLALLGGFIAASWVAARFADQAGSRGLQLAGLGVYVAAVGILFAPLIAFASIAAPGAISTVVIVTAMLVAGLTWTAMSTKADFSPLGGLLKIAGLVALGVVVLGAVAGFTLAI